MRVRRTSAKVVFAVLGVLAVLALLWMLTSRLAEMPSSSSPNVTSGSASPVDSVGSVDSASSPSVAPRVDPLPLPAPGLPAGAPPREPAAGSPERAAIVDAVRRDVGNTTRYRIDHLRATPRWAFFSGTEIVPLDGGEEQETDLTVQALLERRTADGALRWDVVERWTLPTDDSASRREFLTRLRARITQDAVPRALFPPDLFQ